MPYPILDVYFLSNCLIYYSEMIQWCREVYILDLLGIIKNR